jgi:uncharacterized membrane protein YcfT
MSSVQSSDKAKRHAWVDYAKGICIIGVVTFYVGDYMHENLGSRGWMQYWIDFARPFRMPDFFLLSGLFLARVIDRPWRDYLDKKVVHYLYFYVLWTAIFFGVKVFTETTGIVEPKPEGTLLEWIFVRPFNMLWFIQMLPIMFLVTRLLRPVPVWVVLPVAALLQMFPIYADWVQVEHFCVRYVFFYIGYSLAAHIFRFADWTKENRGLALAGFLAWVVVNFLVTSTGYGNKPGISLILGAAGIAGVITAGTMLSRISWMDWLRYLGQHSIVTYLGFFMPMSAMILVAQRVQTGLDLGTIGAIISTVSILSAMVLFWLTRNTWFKILFARPAWAHLPGARHKLAEAAG